MNEQTQTEDVRHQAAAVLSGAKLRMLESAGLMVVSVEEQHMLVKHLRHALRQWRMYAGDARMGEPFPLAIPEDIESRLWRDADNAAQKTEDSVLDHELRQKGLIS